jgi:catechol 2,3-dioxygenase-like lactoylglutathione lyase family enzyme
MATEALLKPNLTQAVPFFRVADMSKSLDFYVGGLGFEIGPKWVVDDRIRWCWLSRSTVAFMLQQFPTEGHDSWKPATPLKGDGVSICVMCEDAIGLYRELKGRGVEASRPFVGNRLWVTQVTDPDGFRIEFESPSEAPEDTQYED